MRRGTVPTLMVLASLAVASPAPAVEDLGDADVVTDSLFVTGDSVTYADGEGQDGDGFAVVETSSSGRVLWDRLRDAPGRQRFYQYTEFGASERRFAYGFAEYLFGGLDDEPLDFVFFSGAAAEPAIPVLKCEGDPGVPNMAVGGNAVAWQPAACSGRDILVRDYTPGAAVPTRTIPLTEQVAELRLAGRYVAYALHPRDAAASDPETQIVVYDWVAGAEAYRVRGSAAIPLYGGYLFAPFDLQEDGKVVVPSAANGTAVDGPDSCADRFAVAWFSPAEPAGHVLPVRSCVPDLRIDGDRIAFFRRDGARGARLVVSDLAGSSVAAIARFGHHRTGQHFDIDASRIAYTAKGCNVHRLYRDSLAPAAESAFEVPSCPIRIEPSAGRIDRKGIAAIRYTCSRGCSLYTRVQRPFDTEIKATRIGRGKTGTVRFRVPASVRARLRREGSIVMRVFAAIDDSTPVTKRRFAADVHLGRAAEKT